MKSRFLGAISLLSVLLPAVACSSQRTSQNGVYKQNDSFKDRVKRALQQADV
jgi:hypothetical protein